MLEDKAAQLDYEMEIQSRTLGNRGFTLAEVVMSVGIVALVFGGILAGYIQSARRAEWTGYSLAAQALALQQLEQARAAKWDVLATPAVDEITNLPAMTWAELDLPISGNNAVRATNYITVSTIPISANPPASVHMVSVSTVWPFTKGQKTQWFTNTVANYFAPDR